MRELKLQKFNLKNFFFSVSLFAAMTSLFARPVVNNSKRPPPPLLAAPHILALRQKSKDV